MKSRAPGYRLLVKLNPIENKSEVTSSGGIILEQKTKSQLKREQEANTKAQVVSMGPDCFKGLGSGEPWCKVGDFVLINRYSGTLVDVEDDVVYRVINDEDVQLVYEEVV